MALPRRLLMLMVLMVCCAVGPVAASDGCAGPATRDDTATRIASIACAEHRLWYSPFIDEAGRLASLRISEAEALRLGDGTTPAWRRVAQYWQGSGLGWPPEGLPAGVDCFAGPATSHAVAPCRAFLIDTPWSAVFVSYVLGRAGVPGFPPSARHVDYVRDAHRRGVDGPYRLADPDAETPAAGDLMCFVRASSQVFGHAGFRRWLDSPLSGNLAMHCDIVVSTQGGRARLVGGNVLQGVTMRVLPLNATGRFWSLPRRTGADPGCSPATPAGCNLHRQDWVALLKLNPAANVPASPFVPATPQACCTVCALPMPEGMRRCPLPGSTPSP